jgi:hypothetical protein
MADNKLQETTTAEETPKKWTEIAEFRMVLYVVPVAIIFVVISLIFN